ncbi:hypothetical protein AB0K34_22765 [Actinomadura sp. NPDC049382]
MAPAAGAAGAAGSAGLAGPEAPGVHRANGRSPRLGHPLDAPSEDYAEI